MKTLMITMMAIASAFATLAATDPVDTNEWIGDPATHSGEWGVADNWSLKRVPNDSDLAFLKFYSDRPNYTVTINGSQKCSQLRIEDKTTAGVRTTTFDGTGTLTLQCSNNCANDFGKRGQVVIDGPTITSEHSCFYLHAPLTVKSGALVIPTSAESSIVFLWNDNAAITVEGGQLSTRYIEYVNATPGRITVNGGSLTVNSSVYPYTSDPVANNCLKVTITGGSAEFGGLNLQRPGDSLTMTGGYLKIRDMDCQGNDPEISITGGYLCFTFSASHPFYQDRRFICPPGAEVEYPGNYILNNGFELTGADPFHVYTLRTGNAPAYVSRGTIVFTDQVPFGMNGSQPDFHIYGPSTFRSRADMPVSTANCYVYCYGKITMDTRDWTDPSVKRNLYFRGIASGEGTLDLDVVGGGTVSIAPVFTYTSYHSTRVGDGTTLALVDRDASADWGHYCTESLALEAGAKLAFNATKNFMQTGDWNVDATARIVVTVPTGFEGATALLLDSDGDAIAQEIVDCVELTGDGAAGCTLVNAYGQLSLFKEPATREVGKWGSYEWTGAGADSNWSTPGNWYNSVPPPEKVSVCFGASSVTASTFDHFVPSGSTIENLTFKDNAINTFVVGGEQMTYHDVNYSISSYSPVPQVVSSQPRIESLSVRSYAEAPIFIQKDAFAKKSTGGVLITQGDIRYAGHFLEMDKISFGGSSVPVTATRMTLGRDAGLKVISQTADLGSSSNKNAGFRVCDGATLTFAATATKYGWGAASQRHVINGTMNVNCPFSTGYDAVYGGRGEINITSKTIAGGNHARTTFQDTLDVTLCSWDSECFYYPAPASDLRMYNAISVRGTPTFHVADGWRYGPEQGITLKRTPDQRALKIWKGATLTLDVSNGGTATFDDKIIGEGTLKLAAGTLRLSAALENTAGIEVSAGTTWEVPESIKVGALGGAGTVRLADGVSIEVSGNVDLEDLAFDLGQAVPTAWRTLVVCKGSVVTVPPNADDFKFRTVDVAGGVAIQCKVVTGMAVILR